MESKLYEECHEGGGFMAQQAMLKQDETVRTQIPTMKTLGGSDAPKKAEKAAPEAAVKAPEPIDFSKVKIEPLFEEQVDFDTFSKSDYRAVKIKDCVAVPKSKKLLQFTLDDGSGTDRTIASVTEVLADAGVNICNFRLSREQKGGQAVMTIEIDGSFGQELNDKVQVLPNIFSSTMLQPI